MKHLITFCLFLIIGASNISAVTIDTVITTPSINSLEIAMHISPGAGGILRYKVTQYYGWPHTDMAADTLQIGSTDTLIVFNVTGLCDTTQQVIEIVTTPNGGTPQYNYVTAYTLPAVGVLPPTVLAPIELTGYGLTTTSQSGYASFRSEVSAEGSTNTSATIWMQMVGGTWYSVDWDAALWLSLIYPPTTPCQSHLPHNFEWATYELTTDTFGMFVVYANPIGTVNSDTIWFTVLDGVVRRSGQDSIGTGLTSHLHESTVLSLYPNPASDKLQITDGHSGSSIEVYNTQGQKLLSFTHIPIDGIDIQSLPQGMYFVRMVSPNQYTPVMQRTFIKL